MQAFAAAWKAATAAEKVNPTDASLYITGIAARTRALTAFAAEISAKLPSQYDTACPGLNPATMVDFTCRAISHFCKEVRSIDVAASLAPVAQLSRDVRGAASSLPNTAVVDLAKALSAAVYNIGVKEVTDRRFGQAALLFEEACVVWESCFEQLLVPLSAILIAASELPSKSIAVVASIGKAMATEKGSSDGDGDVLTALLPSALARAQRWTIVTQLNSVQPPLLRFPRDLPQCILASPALHPMTEIVLTALGLPESGPSLFICIFMYYYTLHKHG